MSQPDSNSNRKTIQQFLRLDPPSCKGTLCDYYKRAQELQTIESALKERLKELRCLYGISQLVEEHSKSLPALLQSVVELLPPSWQYPDDCCACITLYDQRYESARFRDAPWRQSAAILIQGQTAGTVEVFYLQAMPASAEGPFLREERDLINAVAERIGKIVDRFQVEQQLETDRVSLEEANAALRRVLAEVEHEKAKIRESISANVEKIFMPILQALGSEIPEQQKKYVELLKKHLGDFVSPFVVNVSRVCGKLTPVEIEICDMVRNGLSTKEIARLRHVAPTTVAKQRERIRRKLSIAKTETNLAAHLQMLSSEQKTPANALFQ